MQLVTRTKHEANRICALTAAVATLLLSGCGATDSACPAAPIEQLDTAGSETPSAPLSAENKPKDIRRLLTAMGADQSFEAMMKQVVAPFWERMSMPKDVISGFQAKLSYKFMEQVVLPIYDKTFTHEEILALIEVYESPIGRSLTAKGPALQVDLFNAGSNWGEILAPQVIEELMQEQASATAQHRK